jgi:hypothetical protein
MGVKGTTEAEMKEKRALVLTRVTSANNLDIWANLAVLNPRTFAEKQADYGLIHDYTVYEQDGELYDAGGKLATVIKYGEEETNTGNEWIDGKPIYRRVFTGNAATANNISVTLMTGVAFIVACGGGWQPGYSSGDYVCLTAPGNNQISCTGGLYLKGNGSMVFYSSSAASRENGYNAYGIWAEYTKK